MSYRYLDQILLGKVETTPGTDAVPTVALNAIRVEDPRTPAELQNVETNEVTGSLDAGSSIPAGGFRSLQARVNLRGSGASGTVLPEIDPLLRASSFASLALAADISGTAQAGAVSSITLAATVVAPDLRGFVVELTAGLGSGQRRIITAWNSTTKVATVHPAWTTTPDTTSNYTVRKGHRYSLQSTLLELATVYRYLNRGDGGLSRLERIAGCAMNAQFNVSPRAIGYFDFRGRGKLTDQEDVTKPTGLVYQGNATPPFMDAQVYLGSERIKLNSFQMDLANEVTMEDDPNEAYGYSLAGITRRRVAGSLRVPKALISSRNAVAAWRDSTKQTMSCIYGPAIGNRFAILVPDITYTGQTDENVQGFNYDNLPFRAFGENTGFVITYW